MEHIFVILGAAIVAFLIGGLWYSPALFAKPWMKAHGHTPERLQHMMDSAKRAYGVSVLCLVIMAFIMHLLISHLDGVDHVLPGMELGAIFWGGFVATTGLMGYMYSDKPIAAFVIDAGYQLVYMMVMGGILAAWG